MTGASHSTLPSSTSMARAVAVNTLVFDAMPNRVWASTGVGSPRRRTP